jgi:hypothetical protein
MIVTVVALLALSQIPTVAAEEAPNLEQEICQKICEPLPARKRMHQKEFVKNCKKGTLSLELENGWETKPSMATPVISAFDCSNLCGDVRSLSPILALP